VTALNARFYAKVRVDFDTNCWLWVGAVQTSGYGSVGIGNKRTALVHRLSYEAHNGPIPDGLTIDHLCRNKTCVNPDHLEPVTLAENIRRAAAAITHCVHGHELTPENLLNRKDGKRNCRTCANERRRIKRPDRRRRENRTELTTS
jgi:hypothetical protein